MVCIWFVYGCDCETSKVKRERIEGKESSSALWRISKRVFDHKTDKRHTAPEGNLRL
jgi:hypothetical protein